MATTSQPPESELVGVERSLDEADGARLVAVDLEAGADVPLVVRLVDDLGVGVDGVRVRPETEPERWTVEPTRFVAETLVTPDETTTLRYELHGDEPASEGLSVAQAQPIDPADATGALPKFRDALSFDGRADGGITPTEATDEQVRRAVRGVDADESRPLADIEPRDEVLDLPEPE